MAILKDTNIPQTGMVSKHPMNVQESEYLFQLNGNIQTDITGPVTLTNEHSNLLCLQNKFNDGFQVIGEYFAPEINLTFLFFSNEDGRSEIGYITECDYNLITDIDYPKQNPCDNCDTINVEQIENLTTACCQYYCIATSSCLNFSIDYPIRKVVYKKDYCGHTLYFTDFNNPIRCIKLNTEFQLDISVRAIKHYTASCDDEPTIGTSCEQLSEMGCVCCQPVYYPLCSDDDYIEGQPDVDCDKLRLFPQTDHICIVASSVQQGGTLKAGTYQLAACYADGNSQRATRTFAVSNPVSIFDPNQTITEETNYTTNLSVKFDLSNLDISVYKYINIFGIATINNETSVKEYDTIDITSIVNDTYTYVLSDWEKGKDVTIDDVLEIFPVYDKAQEITTVGDTLLLGNLVAPKDLNLQQAVIGLSDNIRWSTIEVSEDFYKDGVNSANSRSFMRDELYGLGIVFERNNTLDTCVYPLIGRDVNQSFGCVEGVNSSCDSLWEGLLGSSWVSYPGSSIFNYVGQWIPTRNYYKRTSEGDPYDVVRYNGIYYIASSDVTLGSNPPTSNTSWIQITIVGSCFQPINDTETISNNDVLNFPSCGESEDTSARWKTYNTALNLGKACNAQSITIECQDLTKNISCNSYTFSPQIFNASWNDSPSGSVTFYTNEDLSALVALGSEITSTCFPSDASGIVVTGFDSSGNIIANTPIDLDGEPSGCNISILTNCESDCNDTCYPSDCFVDLKDCGPCETNYPTNINDVTHCTSDCNCPPFPPAVSDGCNPGFVRTRTDAENFFNINGYYKLCIDSTLVQYDNLLMDPFVVKLSSTPQKVSDATTADYYVYDIQNIGQQFTPLSDPTAVPTETGINLAAGFTQLKKSGVSISNYMFSGVNTPTSNPSNYSPTNGITSYMISPENNCISTNTNIYLLGENLNTPSPTCTTCETCTWTSGDYWNINQSSPVGPSEVQNNMYQSYWYSITPNSSQSTVVIKSSIAYKFGSFTGDGHTPDSTTVGSKDFQEAGDYRIDVYEGSPYGVPKWSTGLDPTFTPNFYYTNATIRDNGVLIIGDVANSSGDPTAAGQLPLTTGTSYYVHIYLLPQGLAKVNKTPIVNSADTSDQYPCYFANYGYLNLCINTATSEETKTITTPETWEVSCKYELHYRQNKVITPECSNQTFEYGTFSYWESQTKIYPNNPTVWGDLCGKPIRHFKFPDCLVSKLQNQDPNPSYDSNGNYTGNFGHLSNIYPIGLRIDSEDIRAWLDYAALPSPQGLGLISQEERNQITGYKIVRSNRVGNKSIIAKGLLYDMWGYQQYNYINSSYQVNPPSYFSSYPFNSLQSDPYLYGNITPPNNGNDKFSFLSADTTFNTPTLGNELKIESINFGGFQGNFYEVQNHPRYILLSTGGIALSATFAALQLAADIMLIVASVLENQTVGISSNVGVPIATGLVAAAEAIQTVPKFFIYQNNWVEIIKNFGTPRNFAKYYVAAGNYHSSGELGEVLNSGNKRRLLDTYSYLLGGNTNVKGNFINNYLREDSVYISLAGQNFDYTGNLLVNPHFSDNSRFLMSSNYDLQSCNPNNRLGRVASFYSSIKNYLPDQYGYLQDIEWLYTGVCNNLIDDSKCNVVFGGDIFISRMTQKRKFPFFLTTTVGAATGVDSIYQYISNVNNTKYYFNSVGITPASAMNFSEVSHKFDCDNTGSSLYLDGTIYLFSYGFASFIGEADYNLNFRYTTDNKFKAFYPYNSDLQSITQEFKVPIETPNAYYYNTTYSKQNKENFFCSQSVISNFQECFTTYPNRVINSLPDQEADFYSDPWRVFLANDYKDFPLTNGNLTGIDGIEKEKLLLRFTKTANVMNAYYTMQTDAGVAQIGTGSLWAQKPLEFSKGGVGYAGSQHHAFATSQYGHFWVDAKRSSIFMLPIGDGGLDEISQPFNNWFNNNLPFNILKDFPNLNVDNNYKDFGITLGWDNRFDRLFVTKRDFEVQRTYKGQITFDGTNFTYKGQIIQLTDSTYFCNKSWTMSYSPMLKTWISYYSFIPNFYIAHENYFQTGINYSQNEDDKELGIWNHLMTNKSFQTYYGKLYPYITDVVVKEQLINKQLQSIEYQADYLRFQNDFDYFYNPALTFNKMIIWSENQNSGNLNLVVQKLNNLSQALLYPKTNIDSTDVLVTRKENNWRVNQFWDLVRNKYDNVPPMLLGCHPYLKEVNPLAIQYNKPSLQKTRMSSDYFTLRFINDRDSKYMIVNKWMFSNSIKSTT